MPLLVRSLCVSVPNLAPWTIFLLKVQPMFALWFSLCCLPSTWIFFLVTFSLLSALQSFTFLHRFYVCIDKGWPGPPVLWWFPVPRCVPFAPSVFLGAASFCILQDVSGHVSNDGTGCWFGVAYPSVCLLCWVGFGDSKGRVRAGRPSPSCLEHRSSSICQGWQSRFFARGATSTQQCPSKPRGGRGGRRA